MTNERLGIYDELRARARPFAERDNDRKRMLQLGPAYNGAYSQPTNPFVPPTPTVPVPVAVQVKKREGGYHARHPDHRRRSRKIWPESELGANIAQILQAVCMETELTHGDLTCVTRNRRLAWPRHVAMYMIDRYCPSYSLKEIAYLFRRDHTSVMYGIQKTHARLLDGDTWTKTLVANIHQRLAALAQGTS